MSLLNKRFETPYNTAPFSKIKTEDFLPAFVKAIENAKIEIGRFKGLGEMMPAQLKETTMNKETRNLIKVSVPTNKIKYKVTSKLINDLMGKDADLRLKFISENAGKILNLDI